MRSCFSVSYVCESGIEYETRMNLGRKANDTIMRPHTHGALEIALVTRGCSHIECGGESIFLNAPVLVCYPPDIPHSQNNYSSQIYERWCFPILPHILGGPVELPNEFLALRLTTEMGERFAAYARLMQYYHDAHSYTWDRNQDEGMLSPHELTRLKHLLLLFLNEMKPLIPDAVSAKSTYINDVCLYISGHPEERMTLDALADRFFVGRATLTSDFRRTMGMSVGEFITTVRVNRAKVLLQEDLPLGEIAERCGFSSVSYFIKVFIRRAGLSPTRYRSALGALPKE